VCASGSFWRASNEILMTSAGEDYVSGVRAQSQEVASFLAPLSDATPHNRRHLSQARRALEHLGVPR
jgi:hypothetical protein